MENNKHVEDHLQGFEDAIANVCEYFVSVHNALGNIVLGTHPDDEKLLIVPEDQYLQVMNSLSQQAKNLAESVGLVVEDIQTVVEQNQGENNE